MVTQQPDLFSGSPGQGSHVHSRLSYYELGPVRSERLDQVVDFLKTRGPATDREIMSGLGFMDPNSVRPRITEGISSLRIRECGRKRCPWTGKTVRVVEAIRA